MRPAASCEPLPGPDPLHFYGRRYAARDGCEPLPGPDPLHLRSDEDRQRAVVNRSRALIHYTSHAQAKGD